MDRDPDTIHDATRSVSPQIDGILESLRGNIRRYVLVHGILLALIWISASWWVALALDYGPVMLGLAELSRNVRLVLLVAMLCGLGWIFYRRVFQRVRQRFSRHSLALVLERRFPDLDDALATVVQDPQVADREELAGLSAADTVLAQKHHRQMLDNARQRARQTLAKVSLTDVFDFRPLVTTGLLALGLAGSIAWFASNNGEAFATGFRRVYLLDSERWPRECHVEMVGLKVKQAESVEGIESMNATRPFQAGKVVVGKTSSVSLLVRAEMPAADNPDRRLPRLCEFLFQTASGKRGRLVMNKVGGARDGFQTYAIDEDVLEGVTEDIRFTVRAGDHRIGPFTIATNPSPVLVQTTLACEYPDYLVDESSSRFTSRTIPLTHGLKLPVGTRATLMAKANRPLQRVFVLNADGELSQQLPLAGDSVARFEMPLEKISRAIELGLVLEDVDGVFSRLVHHVRLGAEEDAPPQVTSRLKGIGSAITPQALIPVLAEINDRNGVRETWIELQTPLTDVLKLTQPAGDATLESEVDLRQMRISGEIPSDLPVQPPGEIVLTVVAQDYFNLDGGTNIGAGTRHPLEIVTADRLLRILERDEADQRFRLEQIYRELTDARGYIARSRSVSQGTAAGFEPGDQVETAGPREVSLEDWQLRQLYSQRALLQIQKSMQEIEGVALTFRDIRLQLVNNRIDAEDRKQRLEQDVARPLLRIATVSLPALEEMLERADPLYRQISEAFGDDVTITGLVGQLEQPVAEALTAADGILSEIQEVLDSLLKFETQNELLDIVRRLLEQQQQLQQRTRAIREREAFDDLFNQ